jgi:hypothetical protein
MFLAVRPCQEITLMDLTMWLPAIISLGLVSMAACYAFIGACESI